jgi:hypothetical protein
VQSKLLFEKEEEEDDIFEDAHFTAFCISSFLRERERERERVGRTTLKCKCKKATTDRKLKRNETKKKTERTGVFRV